MPDNQKRDYSLNNIFDILLTNYAYFITNFIKKIYISVMNSVLF